MQVKLTQVINRVVTKNITGKNANQHIYEFSLSSAYDASTLSFTTATSLVRIFQYVEVQTSGFTTIIIIEVSILHSQAGLSTIEGISFNNDGTKLYACW